MAKRLTVGMAVRVDWIDAGYRAGWESPERDFPPPPARTRGVVTMVTRTYVTLAMSESKELGTVADKLTIPRGTIVAWREIP